MGRTAALHGPPLPLQIHACGEGHCQIFLRLQLLKSMRRKSWHVQSPRRLGRAGVGAPRADGEVRVLSITARSTGDVSQQGWPLDYLM